MTFREKMQAVAEILGAKSEPVFEDRPAEAQHITFPDGVQIFARSGGWGNEGRIEFSGSWPSYVRTEGSREIVTPRDIWINNERLASPSITVNDGKSAEQIAKDITRRLLEDLRFAWLQCKKRCVESERYHVRRKNLTLDVAQRTGGRPYVTDHIGTIEYGCDVGKAEYRGGYGDNEAAYFKVTLEHVRPEDLAEVLAVVRSKQKRAA